MWQKLSYSDKTSTPALEMADILKYCPQLTQREAEVMHWLLLGKTNKDIAEILELSPRTVNKHLEHVLKNFVLKTELLPWRILIVWCKSFIKLIKS